MTFHQNIYIVEYVFGQMRNWFLEFGILDQNIHQFEKEYNIEEVQVSVRIRSGGFCFFIKNRKLIIISRLTSMNLHRRLKQFKYEKTIIFQSI